MIICCKVLLALTIATSVHPAVGGSIEAHGVWPAAVTSDSVGSQGDEPRSLYAVSEIDETLADDDDVSQDKPAAGHFGRSLKTAAHFFRARWRCHGWRLSQRFSGSRFRAA